MKNLLRAIRDLAQYPTAIASMVIILILIGISIATLIVYPYKEVVNLWRGGEEVWYKLPRNVPPAWTNFFRREKLPDTLILNSAKEEGQKVYTTTSTGRKIDITFDIDYKYDKFPQEFILYFTSKYVEKTPFVSITWKTPDGRDLRIGDFAVKKTETYRLSQDTKLKRRLGGVPVEVGLLTIPNANPPTPLKGLYKIVISVTTFEADSDVEAELIMHGEVYGIAGTDHLRRDLKIALLWGFPIALSFGLIAALGHLVWGLGRRIDPTHHRSQPGPSAITHPDHGRHFLLP
jgi:peptide/nickel transport system permease protein